MFVKVFIVILSFCICVESRIGTEFLQKSYDSFVNFKNRTFDFFKKSWMIPVNFVSRQVSKISFKFKNVMKKLIQNVDGEKKKTDTKKTAVQMIDQDGYRVEVHTVLTDDGYVLVLHRILPLRNLKRTNVVILHHGLMGSSDDWLLLGRDQALPYQLTKAGYDVWLMNSRGNKYSRLHISHPADSKEFWNFSFHEIGTLDLPAVIEYIIHEANNDSQVNFVGFSMGATACLVLLSTQPRFNRVIKSAILLAPLAFMHKIKGPFKVLAESYKRNHSNFHNILGMNESMPIDSFPRKVIEQFCSGDDRLCANPFLLIANGGMEIQNKDILSSLLSHLPLGTSLKTLQHYMQLMNTGEFRLYDYGGQINLKKYGVEIPPIYNLSNITLPITLFYSPSDWLATREGVLKLMATLPKIISIQVNEPDFSHTDFTWGDNAPIVVFEILIEALKPQ